MEIVIFTKWILSPNNFFRNPFFPCRWVCQLGATASSEDPFGISMEWSNFIALGGKAKVLKTQECPRNKICCECIYSWSCGSSLLHTPKVVSIIERLTVADRKHWIRRVLKSGLSLEYSSAKVSMDSLGAEKVYNWLTTYNKDEAKIFRP